MTVCVYARRPSPNQSKTKGKTFSFCRHVFHNICQQRNTSLFLLTLSSRSPDDCCSDQDLHSMLIPRGCSTPSVMPSTSPSIPIPTHSGLSFSPPGMLVFSSSPCSSLPPLPFGSAPRRNLLSKSEATLSQGSLRLSPSNRNSVCSLLSTSTCSETSYILGR